ncbi:MAG: DUF1501 domain-containing protein [Planctomycetota bacterium]|nr:DUF1501 domain-containing protein [Planctomycetota bacterium]MDA1211217.1 DUF1501 domain-containing protein [Planctomycetota bacterium]
MHLSEPRQNDSQSTCRRDFLKAGGVSLGIPAIADLLRLQSHAARARPKSVIIICLPGGPSHLDMYDMKPQASSDYRGEFSPIATNVPGMELCELMPLQATIADKFAVVRNMTFIQGDHQMHEVYTGFPGAPQAPFLSPPVRPAFGSIVSKVLDTSHTFLPNYIAIGRSEFNNIAASEVPLYLGPAHSPFEPKREDLGNLELKDGMTFDRLSDRQLLRTTFDRLRSDLDNSGQMDGVDHFTAKAVEMMTSPEVRAAFDVEQEDPATREMYGREVKFKWPYQNGHTWHSSRFLLARRLAEAGVPIITLAEGGWDDHGKVNSASPVGNVFERLREKLPAYDRSIHALVTDIHQRGLQNEIAVLVWGEFGRTPRINFAAGRDHWPRAGFAWFAGGGFRTGQVIGQTDKNGERPINKGYNPQNVFSTLYHFLGIDPDLSTYQHPSGRPLHLLDDTERIVELEA